MRKEIKMGHGYPEELIGYCSNDNFLTEETCLDAGWVWSEEIIDVNGNGIWDPCGIPFEEISLSGVNDIGSSGETLKLKELLFLDQAELEMMILDYEEDDSGGFCLNIEAYSIYDENGKTKYRNNEKL